MRPIAGLTFSLAVLAACAVPETTTPPPARTLSIDLDPSPARTVSLDLALIPAGAFTMGNTGEGRDIAYSWCSLECERPRHEVIMAEPFYMSTTEITQAQWLAVMGAFPEEPPTPYYGEGDNHPVYFISWTDAREFVAALNQLGLGTFRLPSEAEWEYACRGPADSPTRYAPFSFGDSPDCDMNGCVEGCELFGRYMIYNCTEGTGTRPVASRLPNGFGLYDMHGNLCEWVEDYWHDDYTGAPTDGSAWISPPHHTRVLRSGYWDYGATACRTAYRAWLPPHRRDIHVGFRVVREP